MPRERVAHESWTLFLLFSSREVTLDSWAMKSDPSSQLTKGKLGLFCCGVVED